MRVDASKYGIRRKAHGDPGDSDSGPESQVDDTKRRNSRALAATGRIGFGGGRKHGLDCSPPVRKRQADFSGMNPLLLRTRTLQVIVGASIFGCVTFAVVAIVVGSLAGPPVHPPILTYVA